jgi:hypothetical protein
VNRLIASTDKFLPEAPVFVVSVLRIGYQIVGVETAASVEL